ncbi:MAG: LysR family transcriptional regulator [Microbacterium sp.]|uniref:LysR family transcriptional regulator n=1 Tax=Microbacterium sp. TaxID=51671 RepID=UPI0039E5C4AF
MDTEALRWFQMVADGATVTEVAELEMKSQPSVSRALARLDDEVGAPLFRRSGRLLALTHAGAAFHRHLGGALHRLDDGLAAVQQIADPETGTVTLAFQPSLGTWLIPDLIGSFRSTHPRVRFDLRSKADEHVPAVGPRSAVDLELSTLRVDDADRAWRPLVREPIRLLLPSGHRLADRRSATLAEVADDPFVSLRETSVLRTQLDRICAREGVLLDIAFVADDLPTLRGYVASGLGTAIIPARWDAGAIEPSSPRVHYLELDDPEAYRNVGLSWFRPRRLLPAAELFRAHILARTESGGLPHPVAIP